MKQLLLLSFCVLCLSVSAQETDETIDELTQKINASEKVEKLKWMDSLSTYLTFQTNQNPDSIINETIQVALQFDSLNIALFQLSNKMDYLNNKKGAPEEALQAYEKLKHKVKLLDKPATLARLYLNIGDSYYYLKDYEKSINYYDTTQTYAKKGAAKKLLGLAKMYKAGSQSQMGEFAKSSQGLQESIRIFQILKDTFNIISAKNSLSILYSQNSFFEEAKKERDEAIKMAKAKNSHAQLVSFYYNAATDANKLNDQKSRIANLKLAKEAAEKSWHADFYKPTMLASMVIAFAQTDSIKKAEKHFNEIKSGPETYRTGTNKENYIEALKHLWYAKKDYQKALRYAKEHVMIKRQNSDYEDLMNAEKFLANVYDSLGNSSQAYVHFKAYEAIKDSISNVQKVKALSYYQTLYETEKRDAKIEIQQSDIALLDAENRLKNQWLLFGGLGMLGVFGGIVLIRSRSAVKKRQKLQEKFSQDLIKAQEDERTRVARELHDSVGQKLMLLTKKTKSTGDRDMESLAGNTLEELRSISRGLHPATLEKLGVTKAIETMINEVDANTNIFFTNEIENIDGDLNPDQALHLYRIIQEVLNNMVKHAEAKAASVSIVKKGTTIEALIKDNGNGFEYSEKLNTGESLGMKTLLERAKIIHSKLTIQSAHLKGTSILLQIPT
tara:strand:+ start:319 stop:2331 length:2013 start_codon:yes stop_codon:yes gene_type:complete